MNDRAINASGELIDVRNLPWSYQKRIQSVAKKHSTARERRLSRAKAYQPQYDKVLIELGLLRFTRKGAEKDPFAANVTLTAYAKKNQYLWNNAKGKIMSKNNVKCPHCTKTNTLQYVQTEDVYREITSIDIGNDDVYLGEIDDSFPSETEPDRFYCTECNYYSSWNKLKHYNMKMDLYFKDIK